MSFCVVGESGVPQVFISDNLGTFVEGASKGRGHALRIGMRGELQMGHKMVRGRIMALMVPPKGKAKVVVVDDIGSLHIGDGSSFELSLNADGTPLFDQIPMEDERRMQARRFLEENSQPQASGGSTATARAKNQDVVPIDMFQESKKHVEALNQTVSGLQSKVKIKDRELRRALDEVKQLQGELDGARKELQEEKQRNLVVLSLLSHVNPPNLFQPLALTPNPRALDDPRGSHGHDGHSHHSHHRRRRHGSRSRSRSKSRSRSRSREKRHRSGSRSSE